MVPLEVMWMFCSQFDISRGYNQALTSHFHFTHVYWNKILPAGLIRGNRMVLVQLPLWHFQLLSKLNNSARICWTGLSKKKKIFWKIKNPRLSLQVQKKRKRVIETGVYTVKLVVLIDKKLLKWIYSPPNELISKCVDKHGLDSPCRD